MRRSLGRSPALAALLLAALPLTGLPGCERARSSASNGQARREWIATTEAGEVSGQARGDVVTYRGIPYAAPPVGALRFRPPQPPAPWSGVRDATRFGPKCPQQTLGGATIGEEDCLTVNVWRPRTDPPAGRGFPVIVFVHGGSNVIGSGSDVHLDGRTLAGEHGVVVVTFNYRLGVLGFLAHPDLSEREGTSGNWAHLDQIAALSWVSRNIASFAGDPDSVTLVGHSAGALSACVLLASPLAAGLVHGAILQSGGCDVAPLAQRERQGERLLQVAGCSPERTTAHDTDPIACARDLPAHDLVALAPPPTPGRARGVADWALPIGGAVDRHVLPDSPWQIFAADEALAMVPIVVGTTADETELFTPTSIASCEAYVQLIEASFAEAAAEVLDAYPCPDDAHARQTYVEVTTDALFHCQARRILAALAPAAGRAGTPLYRYSYAHTRQDPAIRELRAFHGAELQLLFGTMDRLGYEVPESERALAEIMRASWAAFAATGSPITPATPGWTAYDPARDNAVVLAWPVTTIEPLDRPRCRLWDRLAAPR